MHNKISLGDVCISNKLPFVLIAGPCQIQNMEHSLFMAGELQKITSKLDIGFIYKSSFDKANRTSIASQRGVGLEKSLDIFKAIKQKFGCPIITDVHKEDQCSLVAEVVDIIQIPALLCRQTDLLAAASRTGKIINVKKGQFLSPENVINIVEKLNFFGAKNVIITERGTCFGYNNLISDFRALPIMAKTKCPIVFDATHSVQQPGALTNSSGGERQFVEILARAACAVGVAGIFMEVHEDPDNAPSDGPCMMELSKLEKVLSKLKEYDLITKKYDY